MLQFTQLPRNKSDETITSLSLELCEMRNVLDDLTGKTICSLHVDFVDHKDRFGNIYWACTCLLCGEKKVARAAVLRKGKFLTCSSMKCRFFRQVNKTDTCWEWTGVTKETGYGIFYVDPRQTHALAHRVAWEMENGPIPTGLWVLHHCDNPRCVCPSHLFLGDSKENVVDMCLKGRHRGGHPLAGRPMTEDERVEMRKDAAVLTRVELAAKYTVSLATVGRVLSRK